MSELNPLTQHRFITGGHTEKKKNINITKADSKTTPTYQSATAEEDHENDECFKPVVLHNDEAGFPECPPALVMFSLLVDLAALEPVHTTCKGSRSMSNRVILHYKPRHPIEHNFSDLLSNCIDCHSTVLLS